MEGNELLDKDQNLEKIKAMLSPEAKEALSLLSQEEREQLVSFLKQEVKESRIKNEARKQAEQEALQKFDSLIEEGKKYIDESKWQEWVDYESKFRSNDPYILDVIERVVEVMKMLDDGMSPEEIKNKMLVEWTGDGYFSIRKTVIYFSKHGKEFKNMSKQWFGNEDSIFDKIVDGIASLFRKK